MQYVNYKVNCQIWVFVEETIQVGVVSPLHSPQNEFSMVNQFVVNHNPLKMILQL